MHPGSASLPFEPGASASDTLAALAFPPSFSYRDHRPYPPNSPHQTGLYSLVDQQAPYNSHSAPITTDPPPHPITTDESFSHDLVPLYPSAGSAGFEHFASAPFSVANDSTPLYPPEPRSFEVYPTYHRRAHSGMPGTAQLELEAWASGSGWSQGSQAQESGGHLAAPRAIRPPDPQYVYTEHLSPQHSPPLSGISPYHQAPTESGEQWLAAFALPPSSSHAYIPSHPPPPHQTIYPFFVPGKKRPYSADGEPSGLVANASLHSPFANPYLGLDLVPPPPERRQRKSALRVPPCLPPSLTAAAALPPQASTSALPRVPHLAPAATLRLLTTVSAARPPTTIRRRSVSEDADHLTPCTQCGASIAKLVFRGKPEYLRVAHHAAYLCLRCSPQLEQDWLAPPEDDGIGLEDEVTYATTLSAAVDRLQGVPMVERDMRPPPRKDGSGNMRVATDKRIVTCASSPLPCLLAQ